MLQLPGENVRKTCQNIATSKNFLNRTLIVGDPFLRTKINRKAPTQQREISGEQHVSEWKKTHDARTSDRSLMSKIQKELVKITHMHTHTHTHTHKHNTVNYVRPAWLYKQPKNYLSHMQMPVIRTEF